MSSRACILLLWLVSAVTAGHWLPNMTRKNKRGGKGRSAQSGSGSEHQQTQMVKITNPDATRYRGPITVRGSSVSSEPIERNVSYYAAINASVSGNVDFVLGTGLVTSLGDWANISGTYHEYRVLGMEMDFVPIVSYTSSYPPIVWVVDRNNSSTLGNYTTAANHESAKISSSRYPHRYRWIMDGPSESVWTPVATTFNAGYLKGFGNNFASSQNVGAYLLRFRLQLRVAS